MVGISDEFKRALPGVGDDRKVVNCYLRTISEKGSGHYVAGDTHAGISELSRYQLTSDADAPDWVVKKRKEITAQLTEKQQQCEALIDPEHLPAEQTIFVSIGSGNENSQLWPMPYYDARYQRNESVLNIVMEEAHCLPKLATPLARWEGETLVLPEGYADWSPLMTLSHACRYGTNDLTYLAGLLQRTRTMSFPVRFPFGYHKPPFDEYQRGSLWNSEEAVAQFKDRWKLFLVNALKAKKNIFLGYYPFRVPDGYFLDVYNELKKEYPYQLFLLIGHEGYSAVPVGAVTVEELREAGFKEASRDEEPIRSRFKFFKEEERGLLHPDLTLNNLQKWVTESLEKKTSVSSEPKVVDDRSEIDVIRAAICAPLKEEMMAFLDRRDLDYKHQLRAIDRKRYDVINQLHERVCDIASQVDKTLPDWKTRYHAQLKQAVGDCLSKRALDKYGRLEKLGIVLLNVIAVLFAPIKYRVTGTWFFSTTGKPKEAVQEARDAVTCNFI